MDSETLFIILSAVLASSNVAQIFYMKSYKKKKNAEADKAELDVSIKKYKFQDEQFQSILVRLGRYQEDYYKLQDTMRKDRDEHEKKYREYNDQIHANCIEIAQLKSKIVYLKDLRCYDSTCNHRMRNNPENK